jgi:hypothetical protein
MARHPDADRPIDTGVVVPAAIRMQGARADALMRGEDPDAPPQPTPPVAGDPPQEPAPPQPSEPAPLQPQPEPEPQPAPPGTLDAQWENRYRAMKGRFEALQVQSQRTINDLNQRLNEREVELQQLRAGAPAPGQPAAGDPPTGFDAEDETTWGADMVGMVNRRINAAVQAALKGVDTRVQSVENMTAQQRQDAMDAELDRRLPGGNGQASWRDLNDDPQFGAWLHLRDPLSGDIRLNMLRKAYAEFDTQRVFNFFNSFIAEASPAPAGGQQPGPTPPAPTPGPAPSNRIPLTSLAAPGPARPAASTPPSAPQAKRIWKNSEIASFFRAKSRGDYDKTPELRAEADALEADIFAAQTENRVHPG